MQVEDIRKLRHKLTKALVKLCNKGFFTIAMIDRRTDLVRDERNR
jgi:hypothetical protein